MIPLILVSDDEKKIDSFIDEYIRKNNILTNFIFKLFPKVKEFSIDQIREIKKNVSFNTPSFRLYIFYNFHLSSLEAQNAFLKTLEETPIKTQFLLIVNNHHKLLPTIISRSRIIFLEKNRGFNLDREMTLELEEFIKTGNLKILSSKNFNAKLSSNPLEIIDQMIFFFKNRLIQDNKAVSVLKETLRMKSLMENNNLDPQFTLDNLLIFIKNTYA